MKRANPLVLAAFLTALSLPAAVLAAGYDDGVTSLSAGDYAKAMQDFTGEADKDPRCQYAIGYLYQFGLGVPADLAQARGWYEKAATQNNADALYTLGLLYESAKLGPRNLTEAMRYYRLAAAQGPHGDAEYAIGRMILRGRGVARNPAEGIKWLKLAAQHGNPAGQYMLGEAYESGWGLTPNEAEALYWYGRAAQNDQVELVDYDASFQPKIAIAALKKRLPAATVRAVEARLNQPFEQAKPKLDAKRR